MKQKTKNKIMKAGDAGVPNAEKKMKDLKLGPVLPNLKKAKKNPKSKGDPEKPYWKPRPGAPAGHNIATDVNDNKRRYA